MIVPKKKILFISYDGMTDQLGQSQVIPYMQGLSRHGFEIFLLSCEKRSAFISSRHLVEQMLHGYNINWIPLKYTKNPPVISTLLDILRLKRRAKRIHFHHHIDLVHTRPGVPALVGLWMKKKMGVSFLNDIREFYADSRVEGGMWDLHNPIYKAVYRYFKRKETEQLEKSDGIVCLTYSAREIISKWPAFNKNIPFEVIPCSVDLALFNPSNINQTEKEALKRELHIKDGELIISYLGSMGGWYLTDEMMQFCKALYDSKPEIKFLFISPHRHELIIEAASKYGVPPANVITKKASRLQVPLLLSLSYFSIFFIKPCYSKQSSSPTKHGEIMAMGIPLITNSGVGDVEKVVNKYDSGVVLNALNEMEYKSTAQKIISGYDYDKIRIIQGARDFYSLDTAIKKYQNIYNSILNK